MYNKCTKVRRQEDFAKWKKPCVPLQKPEAVVKENARRRKHFEDKAQSNLVDIALLEAERNSQPSKKGKFGTYEFATKDEDAQDADEANLDTPIEPSFKKTKVLAKEFSQDDSDTAKAKHPDDEGHFPKHGVSKRKAEDGIQGQGEEENQTQK